LEQKIKNLEEENFKLKERIINLEQVRSNLDKAKSPSSTAFKSFSHFEHPFIEHEKYLYTKLFPKMQEMPEEVRFSTLEQMFDKGEELRKDYIKKCFNDIINHIICREAKAFHSIIKNIKMSDLFRKFKTKKRQAKFFSKSEIDPLETYLNKNWSEGYKQLYFKERKTIWKFHKEMTSIVQQLVKIRNNILNIRSELSEAYLKSNDFKTYTKHDVTNCFQIVNEFEEDGFLNPHSLWDLPKKEKSKEICQIYHDGELTE